MNQSKKKNLPNDRIHADDDEQTDFHSLGFYQNLIGYGQMHRFYFVLILACNSAVQKQPFLELKLA